MAIYPTLNYSYIVLINHIQTHLWDIVGLVPDFNKANITIKQIPQIFLLPSVYKNNVYTTAVY